MCLSQTQKPVCEGYTVLYTPLLKVRHSSQGVFVRKTATNFKQTNKQTPKIIDEETKKFKSTEKAYRVKCSDIKKTAKGIEDDAERKNTASEKKESTGSTTAAPKTTTHTLTTHLQKKRRM